MGAPSTHGQRNKSHKTSRHAGVSARKKHRLAKEGGLARAPIKGAAPSGKMERALATKQLRDAKRQELLQRKRRTPVPVVVAVLPLSADVDVARLWSGLRRACEASCSAGGAGGSSRPSGAGEAEEAGMEVECDMTAGVELALATVPIHSRSAGRLTLLPPPSDRQDPLAVVDLAKSAEVLLLVLAGSDGQTVVDQAGSMALAVLRAMGLPSTTLVVQQAAGAGPASGSAASHALRDRSAARKRAEKALASELSDEQRVLHADSAVDFAQLVRHLSDSPPSIPLWRQQRPSVLAEGAAFEGDQQCPTHGTLLLTGYVRYAGLSANQLITVPGAGDFQIDRIERADVPPVLLSHQRADDPLLLQGAGRGARGGAKGQGSGGGTASGRDGGTGGTGGDNAMDECGGTGSRVLAVADPGAREQVVRENVPDPMEGEQTWPTHEELIDAAKFNAQTRRKRVPTGTSEYQAAWIPDDDSDLGEGESGSGSERDEDGDAAMDAEEGGGAGGKVAGAVEDEDEAPEAAALPDDDDDAGSDGMMLGMDEDGPDEDDPAAAARTAAEQYATAKATRHTQELEQLDFPDEVDVPTDMPARIRFQKYRGLKSFRSSPWDPKESLPAEYARVFAFENPKRAHRRALEAAARATRGEDPAAVQPGTYVTIHVSRVPTAAAQRVVQRVQASLQPGGTPPLVAFGLLQHETKLSVMNLGLSLAKGYGEALGNKEELLIVTGVRSFVTRPVLSDDDHGGDKFKMNHFLHAGRHSVAACYAPISFGPLPALAFKLPDAAAEVAVAAGGGSAQRARLAATGRLKGCDPDRVVLKKIVLAGNPVRVHKRRAMVKFMFHHPDDIRWFQPVELVSKAGRRGRITEPVGTHGAMKCLFDGVVQQHDAVCMPLYKRVFPKWPGDVDAFAL